MRRKNPNNSEYNEQTLARRRREEKRMQVYKIRRQAKGRVSLFKNLVALFKLACIIGVLFLISKLLVLPAWYLPSDIFERYPSANLKIIGADIVSEKQVVDELKKMPVPSIPLYLIKTREYEKKLEELSPVKKVFIRRFWLPARLEVNIEEKTPMITIAPTPRAPDIAAIAEDTSLIEKKYLPIDKNKYPTYKVLTYEDYTQWKEKDIRSLHLLMKMVETFTKDKVIYVDLRKKDDIYIQLSTIRIRLGEINSTTVDRIKRLTGLIPEIESKHLKNKIEFIDLKWDKTTLRLKNKEVYNLN